ncbi:MAG: hypothetical protein WAK45_07865 [Methanoregula sp.]|uniref:hypothetical protein n=1 Tax=Methanoregula sp. TaxID=2052170 RepID=UPI003BAE3487
MSGSNVHTVIRKILVLVVVLSALQMTANGGSLTSSFFPVGSLRAGTPDSSFGNVLLPSQHSFPDSSASTSPLLARGGGGHGGGGHGGGNSGGGNSGGGGHGGGNSGGNSGNGNHGGNSGNGNHGGNSGNGNSDMNQGSYSIPVGVKGSTVSTVGNSEQITIDVKTTQLSGEKISQQNNAIVLEKGPIAMTLSINSAPTMNNGQISAKISSISMQSFPVTASFVKEGTVSASFHSEMNNMPPDDAVIGFSLAEQPDSPTKTIIENTVNENGYRLDAVAYTAQVKKTDLEDQKYIGQSVVTMSIEPSWVLNHGGIPDVKIFRLADDGTSQLLDTKFSGLDHSLNMVYTGESPRGLSMFALVSVEPQVTVAPANSPTVSMKPLTPSQTSVVLVPPMAILIAFLTLRDREVLQIQQKPSPKK